MRACVQLTKELREDLAASLHREAQLQQENKDLRAELLRMDKHIRGR